MCQQGVAHPRLHAACLWSCADGLVRLSEAMPDPNEGESVYMLAMLPRLRAGAVAGESGGGSEGGEGGGGEGGVSGEGGASEGQSKGKARRGQQPSAAKRRAASAAARHGSEAATRGDGDGGMRGAAA